MGIDGSAGSRRALEWAAAEARRRGARLHAVLAWEPPVEIVGSSGWIVPDAQALEEYQRLAEERLDAALAESAPLLEGLDVERSAVHGSPVPALLHAAESASELVVGTRGHGGFVGLLLGSVSQQCSQHASCPVVIVPAGGRRP